jgi:hypothetical protein
MDGFVSALVFLFICVSVWAFTTWRKLKNTESLKQLVTWSVCESDDIRYNIPLWAHLKNAQIHTHIRDAYRISGDEEWEAAKGIIERYQNNLTKSYFNGILWVPKSKYMIQGEDFFIFMLYVYLCENQIYGHNVVFHKMHYITYMYCKAHPALQKSVPSWNEGRLNDLLDEDLGKKQMEPCKVPVDPGIKINYRGRP